MIRRVWHRIWTARLTYIILSIVFFCTTICYRVEFNNQKQATKSYKDKYEAVSVVAARRCADCPKCPKPLALQCPSCSRSAPLSPPKDGRFRPAINHSERDGLLDEAERALDGDIPERSTKKLRPQSKEGQYKVIRIPKWVE
jgi:hypothetical protein